MLELGGGPAPWLTAKSGYIQRLECPDEGCSSKLVPYKHTNIVTHHFRVSCLLLGVQVIEGADPGICCVIYCELHQDLLNYLHDPVYLRYI